MRNNTKLEKQMDFELRESCQPLDDRKGRNTKTIQCCLRSLIRGALMRSKVHLFFRIGIG
jgi:hypothetical protein